MTAPNAPADGDAPRLAHPRGADAATGALLAELTAALAPGIQLLHLIGSGAMGLVFLGRDPLLKRLVAIKVLSPGLAHDPSARARFVRESEASAAVTHPNVVAIHLVGELPESRTPFFVMQFIEGRSLAEELAAGVPMPASRVKRMIGAVAAALAAAHEQGLVHRDVKPANIMIEAESDRPLVLDFGISAVRERPGESNARLTTAGTYIGTPTYMSPEQASGEPVTGKSDVYALGLVAYEMFTGAPPFTGPAVVVMAAHVEREPPELESVRPGLDPHLAELVSRCLRKSPDDRPSATSVAQSLLPGPRQLIEWPPPGLEVLHGAGARAMRRWGVAVVAALVFLLVLHLRPTTAAPQGNDGEHSILWGTLSQQSAMLLNNVAIGGWQRPRPGGDAGSIWMFLVAAGASVLAVAVSMALVSALRVARLATRAARAGYASEVIVDVACDAHDDTGALLNGSGVHALLDPRKRTHLLRARRHRTIAGIIVLTMATLAPMLWIAGLPPGTSAPSADIVAASELGWLVGPLLAGAAVLAILDWRMRSAGAIPRRRGMRTAERQRPEVVQAWLRSAGRERPNGRFTGVLVPLASTLVGLLLVGVAYVGLAVFVIVFLSTAMLTAARGGSESVTAVREADRRATNSFVELDAAARAAAIAPQGVTPDWSAARLLTAQRYAKTGEVAPASVLIDLAGARVIAASGEELPVPAGLGQILADSTRAALDRLGEMEAVAHSPWLPVFRRFARSPAYPPLWQYAPHLPGVRYLWEIPIMSFPLSRDLAMRNALAGHIALSRGDAAIGAVRARENIAAGWKLLRGTTLLEALGGAVMIRSGAELLAAVAIAERDESLLAEASALRSHVLRWRRELQAPSPEHAMVADPHDRGVVQRARQSPVPNSQGERLFAVTLGYCFNAREVLFGTSPARRELLRQIADASAIPRARELAVLGEQWLIDANAGTARINDASIRWTWPAAPLEWIGMRGVRQRLGICGGLR